MFSVVRAVFDGTLAGIVALPAVVALAHWWPAASEPRGCHEATETPRVASDSYEEFPFSLARLHAALDYPDYPRVTVPEYNWERSRRE